MTEPQTIRVELVPPADTRPRWVKILSGAAAVVALVLVVAPPRR